MEFLLVCIAHLMADFFFQTNKMIEEKKKNFKAILIHSFIYALVVLPVFIIFNKFWFVALYTVILVISHLLIDLLKAYFNRKYETNNLLQLIFFISDQIFHILILYLLTLIFVNNIFTTDFKEWLTSMSKNNYEYILAIILGVLIATKPFGIVIKYILKELIIRNNKIISERLNIIEQINDASLTKEKEELKSKLLQIEINTKANSNNSGEIIGITERLVILSLMILGFTELIGLILAAKSLARLKKLDDEYFAEIYIIGTLLSILATIVILIFINNFK